MSRCQRWRGSSLPDVWNHTAGRTTAGSRGSSPMSGPDRCSIASTTAQNGGIDSPAGVSRASSSQETVEDSSRDPASTAMEEMTRAWRAAPSGRPARAKTCCNTGGFVSLLSDQGILLDKISKLIGHSSTAVTELVYRKQIRPVLQEGAVAMDRIFKT